LSAPRAAARAPTDFLLASEPLSLIVDGWWSRGYAQSNCETDMAAAPGHELNFQKARCAGSEPATAAADFEDKLMNDLRSNARCRNTPVARYSGPTETSVELYRLMASPHWSLALNFKPAALLQSWSLRDENGNQLQGESETLERLASDICTEILRASRERPPVEDRPQPNATASIR